MGRLSLRQVVYLVIVRRSHRRCYILGNVMRCHRVCFDHCRTMVSRAKSRSSRKLAWNSTLVLSGIFGIAAGAAPNWIGFCSLIACIGFAAGGNLPVDGTMFLEFLPGSKQYLLTFLSIWWAVGQVVGSLISVSPCLYCKTDNQWAFLSKYGCETRTSSSL